MCGVWRRFDEWKTEEQLGCPSLIARWVRDTNAKGTVPRPGQVDVICGGPPCQGVSGARPAPSPLRHRPPCY